MTACNCTGACRDGGGCNGGYTPRIGEYCRDQQLQKFSTVTAIPQWEQIVVNGLVIAQGWECPRCHLINAPHVNSCNCQVRQRNDAVCTVPNEGGPTRQ